MKDSSSFYDGRVCQRLKEYKEPCKGDDQCDGGLVCNIVEAQDQIGKLKRNALIQILVDQFNCKS
jgi:hypothetical protein